MGYELFFLMVKKGGLWGVFGVKMGVERVNGGRKWM
jgi:hypothetical protein